MLRDQKTGRFIGDKNIRKNGYIRKDGYRHIFSPLYYRSGSWGFVLEHIKIYEESRNCCMLKWGIVHHKDHNPINNIWYNLQGMTRAQHMHYHHKNKVVSEESRKRISKGRKGLTTWNKDKHLSENHRLKIGLAQIGKFVSEETRKKLRESHKGQKGHIPWNKGKKKLL